MKNKILQLIKNGEYDKLELKEARDKIPSSIYSTVCAFLNTKGGDIILGVKDNKEIAGINSDKVKSMKQDFLNTINDNFQLSPSAILSIEEIKIEDKILLHIIVPESSQVHRNKNRIYVRKNEGDYDITDKQRLVMSLYLRREKIYTENTIYPKRKLKDLRLEMHI